MEIFMNYSCARQCQIPRPSFRLLCHFRLLRLLSFEEWVHLLEEEQEEANSNCPTLGLILWLIEALPDFPDCWLILSPVGLLLLPRALAVDVSIIRAFSFQTRPM